jgi:hypothetical protein
MLSVWPSKAITVSGFHCISVWIHFCLFVFCLCAFLFVCILFEFLFDSLFDWNQSWLNLCPCVAMNGWVNCWFRRLQLDLILLLWQFSSKQQNWYWFLSKFEKNVKNISKNKNTSLYWFAASTVFRFLIPPFSWFLTPFFVLTFPKYKIWVI